MVVSLQPVLARLAVLPGVSLGLDLEVWLLTGPGVEALTRPSTPNMAVKYTLCLAPYTRIKLLEG